MQPTPDSAAASPSASAGTWPGWAAHRPYSVPSTSAPSDWPVSRAVPSMPAAPPDRCGGAAVTMVWLLGDWNSPKPTPHTASRQASAAPDGCAGSSASASRPNAISPRPMPPSSPLGTRPISRPATGAASTVPAGQAASSQPAWPALRCRPSSSRKGSATAASVCAPKAATEVHIDSRNTGIASRSTGSSGTAWRRARPSWRRT